MARIKGTKIKQARKAARRKARRFAYLGGKSTAPALRLDEHTASKFKPGQKRRNPEHMADRFTAALTASLKTLPTRARRQQLRALSGPHSAPQRVVRKRTKLRKVRMRFYRDMGPGLNVNPPGEWKGINDGAIPEFGTLRYRLRRLARRAMHDASQRGLANVGRGQVA